MKAITFTKKQIKRFACIAGFAVAAAVVAITLIVTSVGTRAAKRQVPIYSVDCKDKKIAVTFDVAWENSNTDELLSILKDNDAKATFFVTGDFCRRHREDVKKFFDAGHEIGNHSDEHPKLVGANVNDIIADTRACSNEIKMVTGSDPTLYRAPSGEYDDNLITTINGMGMQVIQWDVDSVDWKKPSAADIKKKILKGTKPGSILLFHNDLENTTEALPEILENLSSQGYEFVTVSELILKDNFTIDENGVQTPSAESTLKISDEQLEAVLAQYSAEFGIAELSDEQIELAVTAVKSGDVSALPKELRSLAQEVLTYINSTEVLAPTTSSGTQSGANTSSEPLK